MAHRKSSSQILQRIRAWTVPNPRTIMREVLANGITVLAYENFNSPSVVLSGLLWAGAVDEPPDRAGLAAFTAEMLTRGTAHRTFHEIYEAMESVGASLDIGAGYHTTGFSLKALAEDLPALLEILADVLRNPAFPEEEAEKVRGEILTDLQEREQDTRRMAGLRFRETLFQGHPYGRSVDGHRETVQAITQEDLVAFHRKFYSPERMIIAIVGAIRAEEGIEANRRVFGDWMAQRPVPDPLPSASPPDRWIHVHTPISGKTQTDLVMGTVGPARKDPDYYAAALANCILGVFGMMGRLGDHVRDRDGLAYYVYSRLDAGLLPGPWSVIAGVAPEHLPRALEGIRTEIRRLRERRVPAKELEENKSFLIGSLPLQLETNEGIAGVLVDMELFELGLDYLERYPEIMASLNAAEVQAAARKYMDPDRMVLSTAGPEPDPPSLIF
ncbi:MAG: insulinase family protein [Thermoflexus sp.]|nr:insulinase family protein [Thermoflexus sp.]